MASLLAAIPAISQAPAVTAFVNVSVIPMDRERVLTGQTVLVKGDRIVAIGSANRVHVPDGAVRVDGHGKFLLPGMADMHVHLGYPSLAKGDSVVEKMLFLYVANGITTVRDMHSGRDPGAPNRGLALKELVASGKVVGPRIYTAGDPDGTSPKEAAQTTTALKSAGYDFVKISGVSGVVFDSIVAAAHRTGLRIVGHVPGLPDSGLARALRAHYSSIEHLMGYREELFGLSGRWAFVGLGPDMLRPILDTAVWMRPNYQVDPKRLRDIAIATKQAGVWNCPTLYFMNVNLNMGVGVFVNKVDSAKLAKVPLGRMWQRSQMVMFQVVKALQEAGAPLLTGTDQFSDIADIDVPPGFAVHRELALLVQAGLTPYQALEATTRNVAVFLGTADSAGTVAVGKRADLVLLGENPLKDIGAVTSLAGVMVGGRWLTRPAIDARMDTWRTYPRVYQGPYDLTVIRNALWRKP
jgi:imidazolonepropionase-like amidohydrolase